MADYQLDPEAQALVDSGAYVVKDDGSGGHFLLPASVDAGKATRDFGAGWPPAKPPSEPPSPTDPAPEGMPPASDEPPAAPAPSEDPPPAAASSTDGQEASQDGGDVAPVVPPVEEGSSSAGAVPTQG